MTGVAVIMIGGQLGKVTGVSVEGDEFVDQVRSFIKGLGGVHWPTVALSVAVLVVLLTLARVVPRLPGPLIAILLATAVVAVFSLDRNGIRVIGEIPSGLPTPGLPGIGLSELSTLVIPAAGVAIVAFSDNVLTARTFAARHGQRVDANAELRALGVCNAGTGLLHGFPVSSSGSRTALGDALGSRTQLYSVVTLVFVLVVMVAGRGVLAHFPMAALGALVVYAALRLVDVPEFKRLARFRHSELILALATTASVLLFGVLYGVLVAIVLSILDLLRRVAHPHDAVHGFVPGVAGMHDVDDYPEADPEPGLVVYRYDAPLFFANAENFRERALAAVDENPDPVKWFVLNAEANVEVDLTALDVLDALRAELDQPRNRVRDGQGQAGPAGCTRGRRAGRQDRRGPHLHDLADGGRGLPQQPKPVGQPADQHHTAADQHRGNRKQNGQQHAARQAQRGNHLAPQGSMSPAFRLQCHCRRVRYRVVDQHCERGEADRSPHIGNGGDDRDDGTNDKLGAVRAGEPRMHRGQRVGQVPVAGHRQRRPRHAENQRQQRPKRRDRRRGTDHGFEAGLARGPHGVGQRSARRGQTGAAQLRQHGGRDDRVDRQRDAERNRNRPRDGPCGVANLLAEGGDPGVSGEREEQQAGRLQYPGDADVFTEQPRGVDVTESEDEHHHRGERGKHDRDDDAGEQRRLLDARVVDSRQRHHRGRRDGVRIRRPGVDPDRQRHRGARSRLAHHEAPTGGEPPERAEPLAAVHVRPAGLWIQRGQPRR